MKKSWYLISGAPSSGKTAVIKALEKRGYNVVHEGATEVIQRELNKGRTLEDVRFSDVSALQEKLFNIQLEWQKGKEGLVFLDRGVQNIFIFHVFYSVVKLIDLDRDLYQRLAEAFLNIRYEKIFVFDALPLKKNNVRIEDEQDIIVLDKLHEQLLGLLQTPLVRVPVMSIEDRVDFILKEISDIDRVV